MVETALGFLAAFFLFGPLFWITAVTSFFILVWLTETDRDFFAAIALGLFIFAMISVNGLEYNVIDYLKFAGLYFLLGTVWSFFKWVSFLFKSRDKARAFKLEWIEQHNKMVERTEDEGPRFQPIELAVSAEIPFELRLDFIKDAARKLSWVDHSFIDSPDMKAIVPNISNFKGRVVGWIVWWPFSAFWTLLDDPIRRIANAIYNSLQGLYRNVANRIFGDFT